MQQSLSPNYQIVRKTFGYALDYSPSELYQNIREHVKGSTPEHLGGMAAQQIESSLVRQSGGAPLTNAHEEAISLLAAGVKDTTTILHSQYSTILNLVAEQALEIASAPATATSIAKLALREQDSFVLLLRNNVKDVTYQLDGAQRAIEVTNSLVVDPAHGCPFAQRKESNQADPLFNRFIAWAGVLATNHYFDR